MESLKQKVFSIVKKIPKGKTLNYSKIAEKLKTSPRAVGRILKTNFDEKIPCHRVIGKNNLGGYNRGLKLKIKLLKREGII